MPIDKAFKSINDAGRFVELNKIRLKIRNQDDMLNVPEVPGVYWIETTMPEKEIFNPKIYKDKKRVTTPKGTKIIVQEKQNPYIIYNGTESNINRRLKQHLFKEGNEGTGKLGLEIHKGKWKEYEWYVFYMEIEDVPLRNAIEIWWRHNIGWPPFCKR
jgi:hypothetical protein